MAKKHDKAPQEMTKEQRSEIARKQIREDFERLLTPEERERIRKIVGPLGDSEPVVDFSYGGKATRKRGDD